MLTHLPPKERYGIYVIALVFLLATGIVGAKYAQRPAPILFQDQSSSQVTQNPSSGPVEVIVDVTGAVKNPCVVKLSPDSRVKDAIEAAGGSLPDADLIQLNLAAKLADGTQIFVPHKTPEKNKSEVSEPYKGGASAPSAYSTKPVSSTKAKSSGGTKQPAGLVNLNTATSAQLQALPGVGPATAEKIIEYRQAHGGFGSIDELMAVKGIGPKKMELMRKFLSL